MNKFNVFKNVEWIPVVIWMVVIYYLSAQTGQESGKLSHGITEFVLNTCQKLLTFVDIDIEGLHHLIRKNAHFVAYLILGLLTIKASGKQNKFSRRNIALVIFVCVLYAISDEVHQMFVPNRGPAIRDVFIDICGSLTGIIIYILIKIKFWKKISIMFDERLWYNVGCGKSLFPCIYVK